MTDRPALTEIELTEEMVQAGVATLREKHIGESLEQVAKDVFWVMIGAMSAEAKA